jgi:hypothetical protein
MYFPWEWQVHQNTYEIIKVRQDFFEILVYKISYIKVKASRRLINSLSLRI